MKIRHNAKRPNNAAGESTLVPNTTGIFILAFYAGDPPSNSPAIDDLKPKMERVPVIAWAVQQDADKDEDVLIERDPLPVTLVQLPEVWCYVSVWGVSPAPIFTCFQFKDDVYFEDWKQAEAYGFKLAKACRDSGQPMHDARNV